MVHSYVNLPGSERVGSRYVSLHIPHTGIIQNNWWPLCGLSHSVIIIFQNAQSPISTWFCTLVSSGWQLWEDRERVLLWFVVECLEYGLPALVCCFTDIRCSYPCVCRCGTETLQSKWALSIAVSMPALPMMTPGYSGWSNSFVWLNSSNK